MSIRASSRGPAADQLQTCLYSHCLKSRVRPRPPVLQSIVAKDNGRKIPLIIFDRSRTQGYLPCAQTLIKLTSYFIFRSKLEIRGKTNPAKLKQKLN